MANLIAISENCLINPEMIDAVEVIENEMGLQLIIHIGNKEFKATKNTAEVLEQIRQSGVNETGQHFAG